MKKVYKILQVFLISVMILGFSNVGVRDVEAAVPSIEKNATYNLYKGTSYTKFLYINNPRKNGKITHLKNSNPKVVTVAAGNPYSFLEISPKREGKAKITFEHIIDHTKYEFYVSSEKLQYVNIPVGYQHKIDNIGDTELIMVLWANELFDPDNTDTYVMEE